MKKKQIWIGIVVVVVIGVGAFFGGMAVGKSAAAGSRAAQFANFRNGGTSGLTARGGQSGAGFLAGSVIAKDSQSITLQGRDGSSHIVFYATSTAVTKEASSSISDVAVGDDVTAMGTTNSDGSFTASSISVGGGRLQGAPTQAPMIPAPAPTSGQ